MLRIRPLLRLAVSFSFISMIPATAALADTNKLGNDKLKQEGFERLEGKNAFKPGCRHIIRSEDRQQVMHPTHLSNDAIALNLNGKTVSVKRDNKTRVHGADVSVTVWRNCKAI